MVLFLATPHSGAELATFVDAFRDIFGSTVTIEELREHDAHLRNLYNWYRNHAPRLGIETATYYERLGVRGVLTIVNPTSSHPGVGVDPIGLDEDHLSISKPRKPDAQVCDSARNLLINNVLAARAPASTALTSETSNTPAALPVVHETVIRIDRSSFGAQQERRIPCELPPLAEHFTGRNKELKQLTLRLRAGLNTAVVGPAGLGKTALAASALAEIVGANRASLDATPFPDGILYLDLYALHGRAEPAWNALANRLQGYDFMNNAPARNRATEAFRASRVLLVIEGGEEADGKEERTTMPELLGVLSGECRHLLLTRLSTQSAAAESIELREALQPEEAARLFDALTASRPLDPAIRQSVLELLEGHPLALNWAGNLLVRDDEEPAELIRGWKTEGLPLLSDPRQAERTLRWLYERSIRGLDETGQIMLAAAGLLAPTPFSLEAMAAATGLAESGDAGRNRLREHLRKLVQRGLFRLAESGHWRFTHVLAYRFVRDAQSPEAALGDRLAHWLRDALAEALNPSENNSKLSDATALLNHAGALLRADRQHNHWEVLANPLLYAIADRLEELGQLDLVSGALSSVADWLETLPSENRTDPIWLREYTVLVNRKGDVLRDQGDLDGALNAFREALAVRIRLAAADPSNATWQRDLSVSQEKIGDVLRDQGDLDGALNAFREALAVRIRLAAADPSNATWQRDLSFSLTLLAQFHEQQGEPALALPLAEQSLSIDERLSALDKSNVMWQKDVEISRRLVNRLREATTPPGKA
ncbi:tetratricopeptide repeat protein [Chlorobaculum sp. 24CR]|uniref:tetratricopeptide repeat protein n=1 Tax=Chlorobaculum sp. 24CR TaxID=2508878 RepID=UPI00142FD8DA|nr:tetratricopeptide repeat protein [Chlorobaculum sp. 24CR]